MSRSRHSSWRTSPTTIRDGPHPQRLLDQSPQRDLAGALEVGLAGLHRHDVAERDAQLEDLLAGDDPFARRDRGGEAVEQRRLAGLGAAGDEDVEPGGDGRLEEAGRLPGERAEPRPARRASRADHELADVDDQCSRVMSGMTTCSRVPSGSMASTNGVLRSTRRPDDFSIRSTRSLTWSCDRMVVVSSATPSRATNTRAGLVDPDLLDRRVVEVALQRAEAGHGVPHRARRGLDVGDHRQPTEHRPLVVVGHRLAHQTAHLPSSRAGSSPERRISSRTSPSSVWTASTSPPPVADPSATTDVCA